MQQGAQKYLHMHPTYITCAFVCEIGMVSRVAMQPLVLALPSATAAVA
jgi:hypothetical protein